MNCERVAKLLPLHAGDDIVDARARAALAAHLEGCESCRRSAEAWFESVGLLRLAEPPEFDADFFDPIRREVMREISARTKPTAPALVGVFARLFSPRPLAYAASVALVCAALVFALRLWRAPAPSKVADDGVAAGLSRQLPPVTAPPRPSPEHPVPEQAGVKTSKRVRSSRHGSAASRPPFEARSSSAATAARARDDEETSSPPTPPAVLLASSELPGVELSVVKDEREMLKIDLQTGDPGVRIIWFSPRPNE